MIRTFLSISVDVLLAIAYLGSTKSPLECNYTTYMVETIIFEERVFTDSNFHRIFRENIQPTCNCDNTTLLLIYIEQFAFSCGIILYIDSVS